MDFIATPWLTWQRAQNANIVYQDPPVRLGTYYPDWLKNLKADVRHYVPEGFKQNHTARICLGLRGINSVGWTIPWPSSISGDKAYQLAFHPEQLHGTKWCEKDANGEYIWNIVLKALPWRAKMLPGWRLIVGDYPLAFSENWHTFSGCVDANYNISNGQIGAFFTYNEPIDPEFNYYNLETVLAIKKGFVIPKGSVTFSMIPYYDPDYQAPPFTGFPNFNS